MKVLRIGDPHVKVSNLEESEKLLSFVLEQAKLHKVDQIEILGDLFHTHAILRLEVLESWNRWLWALSQEVFTLVLVGNHDQSGNHFSDSHALSVFTALNPDKLLIVDRPALINKIGYLPYIHDNAKFIAEANTLVGLGARAIVSHTTYQGSQYENGFYAPDGVDPVSINAPLLISGHIHSRQRFKTSTGQEVIYPGTARWDTSSDANQPKGLWLVEHDTDGMIVKEEFLDTSKVCTPIIAITLTESQDIPAWPAGARVSVELVGSSDWVAKTKTKLKGTCSIKTKITDTKKLESRKSGRSLEDYIKSVYVTSSVDPQKLFEYMRGIGLV